MSGGSPPTQATILWSEIDHTKGTIRKYEDEICELEVSLRPQNSEDARKSAIQEGIDVIRRTISNLRAEIAAKQAECTALRDSVIPS